MKYPTIDIKIDEANRVVIGLACDKQIKIVAKCNTEDTFDPNFGTRYVSAKVKRTYAKLALQHLKQKRQKFLNKFDAEIRTLEAAILKQTNRVKAIREEKYPEDKA